MSLPDTQLLPRGTKLRLLRDYHMASIMGRPLPHIPKNTIFTVATDFGGGRICVWVPWAPRSSEIVYLWGSDAEVLPKG